MCGYPINSDHTLLFSGVFNGTQIAATTDTDFCTVSEATIHIPWSWKYPKLDQVASGGVVVSIWSTSRVYICSP